MEETPARAAALWDADPDSLRTVNLGVNAVYRFEVRGQGRYLRVTHPGRCSRPKLEAAAAYLRHLSAQGVPVCTPLASQAGRFIEDVMQSGATFFATVTAEAPGMPIGFRHTEPRVYEAWGGSLALLHNAAAAYRPPPSCRYLSWQDLWQETRDLLPSDNVPAQAERASVAAWLETLPPPNEVDFGLTHGDYRPGNVLWDGAQVWTVDFDEPVWQWYAADIARALREFSDRPSEERRRLRGWFVGGYRAVRPLEERWVVDLDWFMRLKILELYAWSTHAGCEERPHGENSREIGLATLRERVAHPVLW